MGVISIKEIFTMSTPSSANVYTQGFGSKSIPGPVISDVNPGTTYSPNWELGQPWINTLGNTVFILTSITTFKGVTTPTWTPLESASGALNTLTGGTGGAISPVAGNITLAGTSGQIATSGSGSTITFSVPAAFVAPGSVTATTFVTAGTSLTASGGNLNLNGVGSKLVIHASTPASDSVGTSAAMTAGSVTVSTTAVTAASKIFVSPATPGGTQGNLSIGTITAGVSFVINSDSGTDTSTVNYLIIN
jgi:hypothetical protein